MNIRWKAIIEVEPRLEVLRQEAVKTVIKETIPAERYWYSYFKPRLVELVGWHAEKKSMKEPALYLIAYKKILDAYGSL